MAARRSAPAAVAALLVVLTAAAFWPVRENGFLTYDDPAYLTKNPVVRQGLTAHGVAWAFSTTRAGIWHPLTWLSHMLDVQLFGLNPAPHHLAGVALQAACAVLLFAALRGATGALWPAAAVAALFAVHPLRVESVAWASERKDLLALLFALAASLAWLRRVRRRGGGVSPAAVGLFGLALLAKPMPVTLPFALLLLDWWPLGRWRPGARPGAAGLLPPAPLWTEKLPLFGLAAAASVVAWIAQAREGAAVAAEALPLTARAANAAVSVVRYVAKTLRPLDLAAFYPHPGRLPPWWQWAGAVALIAAATAGALLASRRRPWLAVGWLWFLGTLVPMLGFVQVGSQALADRYSLLPQVGLLIAAVFGVAASCRTRPLRVAAAAAAIAAVLACAAFTARQVVVWRTSVGLFSQALALAPPAAGPSPAMAWLHNALGLALSEAGRYEEALARFRDALAARPGSAEVLNNAGFALKRLGRAGEAAACFRDAIARDPRQALARNSLADLLIDQGRTAEAVALLREALAIDPGFTLARNNLGIAYAVSGQPAAAEREFRALLAADPGFAPGYDNLARLLDGAGRTAEAAAVRRARQRGGR
jgi:tetratricopeptide (TPR) repeat protein